MIHCRSVVIFILVQLLIPFAALWWFFSSCCLKSQPTTNSGELRTTPLLKDVASDSEADTHAPKPSLLGEKTIRQMICTLEMPLLLFVRLWTNTEGVNRSQSCMFCCRYITVILSGGGYLFTVNIDEMCSSAGLSEAAPSIALTLFSTYG